MNAALIRAEGHRNPMSIRELESRTVAWLVADYRAVVFGLPEDAAAGYALFRQEPEFIYLRHLFIKSEHRRKGLGRASMALLWEEVWNRPNRVRIDVLTGNEAGRRFGKRWDSGNTRSPWKRTRRHPRNPDGFRPGRYRLRTKKLRSPATTMTTPA